VDGEKVTLQEASEAVENWVVVITCELVLKPPVVA
jgi:hypothetical protein